MCGIAIVPEGDHHTKISCTMHIVTASTLYSTLTVFPSIHREMVIRYLSAAQGDVEETNETGGGSNVGGGSGSNVGGGSEDNSTVINHQCECY